MKTEAGVDFPAEAYAYVPAQFKPSTWKLRLWDSPTDKETPKQVGMAVAALGPGGFRGNKVDIPAADLPAVKRKVLAAWHRVNPDAASTDVPNVLKGVLMPEELTIEQIEQKVGVLEGSLAEMTKRAEEAERTLVVAKLDTDDRKAYDTLDKEDQEKFLACKSEDCREALIQKGLDAIAKAAEIPEPIRKRMEEVEKQLTQEKSLREAAEAVIKTERSARRMSELSKRAEQELPSLPGTADEKAATLLAVEDKLTAEESAAVQKLFKAGNEAIAQLGKPVGKDGASDAGDVWGRIEKMAEKVAADSAGKLTKAKAVDVVLRENPDMYKQYLESQPKP